MKGKHHVIIETSKLKYEFDIKRNITIIQGDSATGKTTLVDILRDYSEFGSRTGITLQSDVACIAYTSGILSWEKQLKSCENSIIFIDEGYDFITTEKFASIIKETSNYYVLITREPLCNLPYSINEIYGIRNSGKYNYPQKIYHEFYSLYTDETGNGKFDTVVTEDSKSGFQLL